MARVVDAVLGEGLSELLARLHGGRHRALLPPERGREVARDPGHGDAKTRLQELVARAYGDSPRYELTDSGPDHDKCFLAEVWFAGAVRGKGQGTSKKQAEQAAASQACEEHEFFEEQNHSPSTIQGSTEHAGTP